MGWSAALNQHIPTLSQHITKRATNWWAAWAFSWQKFPKPDPQRDPVGCARLFSRRMLARRICAALRFPCQKLLSCRLVQHLGDSA